MLTAFSRERLARVFICRASLSKSLSSLRMALRSTSFRALASLMRSFKSSMCLIRKRRWSSSLGVELLVEAVVEVVDEEDTLVEDDSDRFSKDLVFSCSSVPHPLDLVGEELGVVLLLLSLLMILSITFLMPSELVVPKLPMLPMVLLPQLLARLMLLPQLLARLMLSLSSKLSFVPTVVGVEGSSCCCCCCCCLDATCFEDCLDFLGEEDLSFIPVNL